MFDLSHPAERMRVHAGWNIAVYKGQEATWLTAIAAQTNEEKARGHGAVALREDVPHPEGSDVAARGAAAVM